MAKGKSTPGMAGGPSDEDMKEWAAEEDFRTLVRAEEIRKDEDRYKKAIACAKKKIKEMRSVIRESDQEDE